jgi:MFS family permease
MSPAPDSLTGQLLTDASNDQASSIDEWRRGSPLVLTAFLGSMAVMPAILALSSMAELLEHQFGWTRAQVTSGQAIYSLGSVAIMPLIGQLADRTGARKIALLGLVAFPFALILIGLSGPQYWTWVVAWAAASMTGQLIAPPVWAIAVTSRFKRSRGLALGAAACGTGLANTLVPLIAVMVIQQYSWRGFYFGLAAFVAMVILPLAYRSFFDASDLASREAGRCPGAARRRERPDGGLRAALHTTTFWGLGAIFVLTSIASGTLLIHAQLILREMGISALSAAGIVGFIGIGGLVGRGMGGWMLDRFSNGPWIAAPACLFPAVASLILLTATADFGGLLALAAFLAGFSLGLELDMLPYMISRYFGLKAFGSLYLTFSAAFVVSSGCSPYVASLIRDQTGSYDELLIFNVAISLLAATLLAFMPSYPRGDSVRMTMR